VRTTTLVGRAAVSSRSGQRQRDKQAQEREWSEHENQALELLRRRKAQKQNKQASQSGPVTWPKRELQGTVECLKCGASFNEYNKCKRHVLYNCTVPHDRSLHRMLPIRDNQKSVVVGWVTEGNEA
jgi:hypothetical protein